MAAKPNVYEIVTERIIEALEKGCVPWHQPWSNVGGHRNLNSKRPYRGINAFLLAMSPYSSPFWTTYKGAQRAGGNVKQGEKGTIVVFFKPLVVDDDKNPGKQKTIPLLRYYRVWNIEQCEGIKAPTQKELVEHDAIEAAQTVIDDLHGDPEINFGGNRAYYNPASDKIQLPQMKQFESAEAFYSTAFHELVHATGHKDRLGRQNWSEAFFGNESYSKEELVAEMGAAMVCGTVGIETQIPASAAYIKSWLKVFKGDQKFLINAASQAQKAADYLLGAQKPEEAINETERIAA